MTARNGLAIGYRAGERGELQELMRYVCYSLHLSLECIYIHTPVHQGWGNGNCNGKCKAPVVVLAHTCTCI